MADGILGLAGGGASSLNQELIDKLKAAEKKSTVDPLETKLETWEKEQEKITEIETKVAELLTSVKNFDLFNLQGNAFEQKTASTTGNGVLFDAVDVAGLEVGTTTVDVTQLATKDVFQSNSVNATTKDTSLGAETLTIKIGTNDAIDFNTSGKTYDELAKEINDTIGLNASVEQVGDDSYRLVIKSTETGTSNALTITGTASQTLGFTTDGTTKNASSHIQVAKNLEAKIDGIDYNSSSNEITTQNGALKITAVETGTTSLNVQKDNSFVISGVTEIVEKYNELVDLMDKAIYENDTPLEETSTMKSILAGIKEKFTGTYGASGDKNIFSFGISLDKEGKFSIDTEKLNDAVANNFDELKEIFIGDPANKGLGTQLKEYLDELNYTGGLLRTYTDDMLERKDDLTKEKEEATKDLDDKYSAMTARFGEYAAIISRMDASFSGLKMMIEQSVASN
jgi:flagellar hook-associated protein 2